MLYSFLVGCALLQATAPAPRPAVVENGVTVYFSPRGDCTKGIVSEIDTATEKIDLAAYTFTSREIASSLIGAHKRGVRVRVCFDSGQVTQQDSRATYLSEAGIAVFVHDKRGIQHNKYLIIDGNTVITGSFNFTRSAETRNRENVVILEGKREVAQAFSDDFAEIVAESKVFKPAP